MEQAFFTVNQARDYLGLLSAGPIYEAIHKGYLAAYRPPPMRNWRIKKEDLDAWIETGKTPSQLEIPPRKRQRRTKRKCVEVLV